ncbi:1-deoxy-D-xylulose-5-phosphate reductoisomerase [Fangia hongkongensis]|uniref:1-deoxy-D-xylulose-5-phosphate reductoisomerase n=1 Tax=Fangia hongkongensis TaxID=270495 RepID=UPI00037A15FC|nr:1-deoxy-D-xylulose-5-phosphate reductoisomerase [Fangia hongkongensis]MBK2126178.1 1-deoxy-D-xylulose-5-phosphate reductoisomerase [Fangia hongkongensis]
MKTISILGATGSIGQNTLKIIADNQDKFNVYALSAHHNYDKILEQARNFQPKYVVIATKALADKLQHALKSEGLETIVLFGAKALIEIARADEVDIVMAAIVGMAGLESSYAAVCAGKKVLLANKESLVAAGNIFMKAVKENGATLLPVDSEHNAIFQCLTDNQYHAKEVDKVILTASGGPFRNKALSDLESITPDEACNHPNWKMGRKISVDSSTMVNKALEVIEAYWLFNVSVDKLEVLIHPQSIVHSMVKYCDGSYIAQLGSPDMKTPIGYSLFFPERQAVNVTPLDLCATSLTFEKADFIRFRALEMVFSLLGEKDYVKSIIFNAANEVLVEAFLAEKIQYLQIIAYIEQTLAELHFSSAKTIEDVIEIDQKTRDFIKQRFLLDDVMYT